MSSCRSDLQVQTCPQKPQRLSWMSSCCKSASGSSRYGIPWLDNRTALSSLCASGCVLKTIMAKRSGILVCSNPQRLKVAPSLECAAGESQDSTGLQRDRRVEEAARYVRYALALQLVISVMGARLCAFQARCKGQTTTTPAPMQLVFWWCTSGRDSPSKAV